MLAIWLCTRPVDGAWVRVGASSLIVTFDLLPRHPLAWQRASSPVNEVGGMVGTVWLSGGGYAPPWQEVGCVVVVEVWWNVIDVIVCHLVLTYFRWAVGHNFLENGPQQDGAVVGVFPLAATPQHDWTRVVGYLLPHGCVSCDLQGHLCSSTHLVNVAS